MTERTIGTAVELLPPGADHNEQEERWHELRREGVTASEIATILGLNTWDSPLALYYRKRGEVMGDPATDRQLLGLALEDYVAARFTEMTGLACRQAAGFLASQERPWQRCTPDRLAADTIIPVELKTAMRSEEWGATGTAMIPLAYRCQLMWQMDVLGAPYGYLSVIFLPGGEPRWYQIDWDGNDVGVMRQAGQAFLAMVATGTPPDVDGTAATAAALRRRYHPGEDEPPATCGASLIRSYRAAIHARDAAQGRLHLCENKIRALMGTAMRLEGPSGETVATRRIYERAGYTVKPSTIDAIYAGKDVK